jgi:hypothetical protein
MPRGTRAGRKWWADPGGWYRGSGCFSARVKYVFSKSRALGNTMVNSWQLTEQIAFLIACRLRPVARCLAGQQFDMVFR